MTTKKARVIAFYLPQFHPIPENDKWWGKGFTEWTNVAKAKPLFRGHYQPRIPADLGYYDLRMPEVREAQAEMASNAGIEGFMYWHYWFGNGKRVLERPFNEVLNSGNPDFPFCLGWANHSWTTHSWNSESQWKKNTTIIEQTYPGESDYIEHFYSVLPAFKDKRYIMIEEKPIFLIYQPFDIPNVEEYLGLWRNLAVKNGLKGIHFVGIGIGWKNNISKVLQLGFDAVNSNGQWESEIKYEGRVLKTIKQIITTKIGGLVLKKYPYDKIMDNFFTDLDKENNVFPTIIPQWDRTPRSGRRTSIYYNSTPEKFRDHLKDALQIVKEKDTEKKIIFLKSWNEWAEGNYVEPDLKFGTKYLDVLTSELFVK